MSEGMQLEDWHRQLVVDEAMLQRWVPTVDFSLTYYLSGPMTGYPNFNYAHFEHSATVLENTGLKIESPHRNPWPEGHEDMLPSQLWREMMVLAMRQMEKCQGIIMLKGWPASRGACKELEWALKHEWPVYYYHEYQIIDMNKGG